MSTLLESAKMTVFKKVGRSGKFDSLNQKELAELVIAFLKGDISPSQFTSPLGVKPHSAPNLVYNFIKEKVRQGALEIKII